MDLLSGSAMLDATRVSDGKHVVHKMIFRSIPPLESETRRYLSSKALRQTPVTIAYLSSMVIPDCEDLDIIVMPLLRAYEALSFKQLASLWGSSADIRGTSLHCCSI
ncbi:hypothetical protein JB92DRAFT_3021672 [Gautieria morchelliformis]|nr:hypothetical protein JB92DRAFT_3021672 [Gautieria morchelliformis]